MLWHPLCLKLFLLVITWLRLHKVETSWKIKWKSVFYSWLKNPPTQENVFSSPWVFKVLKFYSNWIRQKFLNHVSSRQKPRFKINFLKIATVLANRIKWWSNKKGIPNVCMTGMNTCILKKFQKWLHYFL